MPVIVGKERFALFATASDDNFNQINIKDSSSFVTTTKDRYS